MAELFDLLPIILTLVGIFGVGGLLFFLGFWPVITSFLIGTRIGRAISAVGLIVVAIFWANVLGRRKGAKGERAKQKAKDIKLVKEKVKIDESLRKATPAERRKRFERWVS